MHNLENVRSVPFEYATDLTPAPTRNPFAKAWNWFRFHRFSMGYSPAGIVGLAIVTAAFSSAGGAAIGMTGRLIRFLIAHHP
jgi:hypothetical protein